MTLKRSLLALGLLSAISLIAIFGDAQSGRVPAGAEPYSPTKIEWLTLELQSALRSDRLKEDGFLLNIASPDSQTVLIFVRYLPTVQREVMNINVDSARKVAEVVIKAHGWENWARVREDIQMARDEDKH